MERPGSDASARTLSSARLFGVNSAIYGVTNVLQRGTGLLLLPVYTRFMSPDDYGALAVVTALNGFLSVLFTLALPGAMTRFYFEYRNEPELLARFWGTVLISVAILSVTSAVVLLVVGDALAPVIGAVPFWPYVAIGIATTVFQPVLTTFLALLQTRGQALRYAGFALANSAVSISVAVALVVFAGWGALGPLVASLSAATVFACVAIFMLRDEVSLCLDVGFLKKALSYSLPQVPHMVGAQVVAATDRLLLNRLASTASAGLYSVASMFGMVVDLLAYSANRAYVPMAMRVLTDGADSERQELRQLALIVVGTFVFLGGCVALFARELVTLLTDESFHEAFVAVPLIAFSGAAIAVYYVFVNVLFFDARGIRFLPIGTLTSAVVSVLLNLLLIPRFGIVGAGIASLVAQGSTTCVIAAVGKRFEPLRWPYGRILGAYCLCAALACPVAYMDVPGLWIAIGLKLAVAVAIMAATSLCLWGNVYHLPLALADMAHILPNRWMAGRRLET